MVNKKFRTVFIIILVVVTIMGCMFGLVLNLGLPFVKSMFSNASMEIVEDTVEFQDQQVDQIEVDLSYGDINIQTTDRDYCYVDYKMNKGNEPELKVEDGQLTVTGKENDINGFHMETQCAITIYLPEKTKLQNGNLTLDMGDVTLDGISFETLDLADGMGDLKISDAAIGDLTAELSMGDVTMTQVDMEDADFILSMGDINMEEVSLEDGDLTLDMGDCDISGDITKLEADLSMGDFNLDSTKSQKDMDLDVDVDMGSYSVNGKDVED